MGVPMGSARRPPCFSRARAVDLEKTRIRDLVVQEVHDFAKILVQHILPTDALDNPAALHTGEEGLSLGITRIPRRGNDLHGHGPLTALARLVAEDAKWPLLVLDIMRRSCRCRRRKRHISVLGATTLQVLCTDTGNQASSPC